MLKKTMQEALNAHIQEEFYSSYLYLSMSAYCHSINLKGFAHWMQVQSGEENKHAMKMFDFLIQREGKVALKEIQKPPHDFKSILDVMQKALEHEKKITALINKLYELSLKEKDYPTQTMLQWFITEQVEEEAQVSEILQKVELVHEKGSAILYLDKEMKKREAK
ncbi:MAG: ferritin [Deltaproteobacteria bacterium]|nr:ferritin [Deltaproteobacteria bacterium]